MRCNVDRATMLQSLHRVYNVQIHCKFIPIWDLPHLLSVVKILAKLVRSSDRNQNGDGAIIRYGDSIWIIYHGASTRTRLGFERDLGFPPGANRPRGSIFISRTTQDSVAKFQTASRAFVRQP